MNNKIWVIEDDDALRTLLTFLLESEGYDVTPFSDGSSAIREVQDAFPDLALLDIGLPGESGESVCRLLCGDGDRYSIPVIVLTGRNEPTDRYRMFAAGADDFLDKPVDNLELIMRVRNKLRRRVSNQVRCARYIAEGELRLDVTNHVAEVDGRKIDLTPSEFAVLKYLLERPGRAVAIETLLVEALGYPPRLGSPDILRTHVRKIRQKIEPDPAQPRMVMTRPRVGYMLAGGPR